MKVYTLRDASDAYRPVLCLCVDFIEAWYAQRGFVSQGKNSVYIQCDSIPEGCDTCSFTSKDPQLCRLCMAGRAIANYNTETRKESRK